MIREFKGKILIILLLMLNCLAVYSQEYKNTVQGISFSQQGQTVKVNVATSKPYESNIKVNQRLNNTYVILLPETNSKMTEDFKKSLPESVKNVTVTTYPYKDNSYKGYTKITIQTSGNVSCVPVNSAHITQPVVHTETPLKNQVNATPKKIDNNIQTNKNQLKKKDNLKNQIKNDKNNNIKKENFVKQKQVQEKKVKTKKNTPVLQKNYSNKKITKPSNTAVKTTVNEVKKQNFLTEFYNNLGFKNTMLVLSALFFPILVLICIISLTHRYKSKLEELAEINQPINNKKIQNNTIKKDVKITKNNADFKQTMKDIPKEKKIIPHIQPRNTEMLVETITKPEPVILQENPEIIKKEPTAKINEPEKVELVDYTSDFDVNDTKDKSSDLQEDNNMSNNIDYTHTTDDFTEYEPDGFINSFDDENIDDSVFDLFSVTPDGDTPEDDKVFDSLMNDSINTPLASESVEENTPDINNYGLNISEQLELNNNSGLCLVDYENYSALIGYIKDEIFLLKKFDEIICEKIFIRPTEKITDDTTRYLLKIGLYKMMIETTDKFMKHLIDL